VVADVLDFNALWKTIAASLVAGVGVVFLFSVTLLGATRSMEAGQANRPLARIAYGALAIVGLAGTGGAIAVGLIVMAQK
jgi:hypothetical protein